MPENVLPSENSDASTEQISSQEPQNFKHINNPKEFDVQEVRTPPEDDSIKVENGGTVDLGKRLEQLERFEKLRIRKYLTYSILSLSIVWILVGMIHYLLTGNSFLLVASSPMSGPVLIIMGYYFGDHLLQKHINGGP
jgi:hypothetical protein